MHKSAFLYWCQLSDSFRTDKAVADKFEVSAGMVGRWRKSFNWEGRLEALRKETTKDLAEQAKRTLAEDLNLILFAGHAAINKFSLDVKNNKVDISPKDFVLISQELRAVYRELNSSDNGDSDTGGAVNKFAEALSKLGDTSRDVLIRAVEMQVTGGKKTTHEELLEAQVARGIQDEVEISEIGDDTDDEDSGVDFFERSGDDWEPGSAD